MSGQSDRFFFVHVQKTAGTSLIKRLAHTFGQAGVYPNKTDGEIVSCVISVEHLLSRWRARNDEIRVVSGHFPLCTTELLGADFTTLTLLREPVERTLSYLRHHRVLTPAERDRPLEAIYDDSFRFHGLVHNHMVKMFSLTPAEMTGGMLTRVDFTPERLERAKERLAGIDAIGLQEDFDEFCVELTRRFGWRLGEPLHANRTEHFEVSDAFRARIAEDNAMDVELYEFAKRIRERRRAQATASNGPAGGFAGGTGGEPPQAQHQETGH
jgi:Sulfotransferase family